MRGAVVPFGSSSTFAGGEWGDSYFSAETPPEPSSRSSSAEEESGPNAPPGSTAVKGTATTQRTRDPSTPTTSVLSPTGASDGGASTAASGPSRSRAVGEPPPPPLVTAEVVEAIERDADVLARNVVEVIAKLRVSLASAAADTQQHIDLHEEASTVVQATTREAVKVREGVLCFLDYDHCSCFQFTVRVLLCETCNVAPI